MSRSDQTAVVVGVGRSAVGRVPGRNTSQLQLDAAREALADSGLTFADVDGLITLPVRTENWLMPCGALAEYFGLRPRYLTTIDLAGASGVAMLHHAALAVATGQCAVALCVAGQNTLSHVPIPGNAHGLDPGAHAEFETPYGPFKAISSYAMVAQRHIAEYGTTPEQLAQVAVTIRNHAALNPWAQRRKPIEIADVLASPMISTPLHQLECSLISDGAAALVVTTLDRARDLRQRPVKILGQGYGFTHNYAGSHDDLCVTGAVTSGNEAFRHAGLTRRDVDVAELYDCFTITVIVELEDLGFCPKGEGGRFVENGRIELGGELPVTTHGGLLSAAHPGLPGGFFHVLEGVEQVRGTAGDRQVANAEVALVHGNGGVLAVHATMLLGAA